jgi:3,4-dihydroxy 2-butanone 4-phosphate synthase/GTP cyclohydrolase II
MSVISPVADIVAEIKAGRMVVLVDEEDRENEGDLVMAAQCITAEAVNFMARYGRGLICLTLTEERCQQLNLALMVRDNRSPLGTNFTLSIEAASGVTTGISAQDRARTVQVAVARGAKPDDIVQPGHIFPLMAQKGGVLARAGHTEAGCDIAGLAGFEPASVICEILKEDGTMARLPDLVGFAETHGLKIGAIADLIHYRSRNESLVKRAGERTIQTAFGPFRAVAYLEKLSSEVHLALVRGDIDPRGETLVRVHEPLSVMDLLEIDAGSHAWSVHQSLERVSIEGKGVIVLLNCGENAAQLLDRVAETPRTRPPARKELLTHGIGAQILRDLKVGRMRLLAFPRKMPSVTGWELEIAGYEQPSAQKS